MFAHACAGSQAMALSLLSNCVTQPAVLKAVSTGGGGEGQLAVVATTKLLSSQDLTLSTKAATLLGNLCHDSTLRTQVRHTCAPLCILVIRPLVLCLVAEYKYESAYAIMQAQPLCSVPQHIFFVLRPFLGCVWGQLKILTPDRSARPARLADIRCGSRTQGIVGQSYCRSCIF